MIGFGPSSLALEVIARQRAEALLAEAEHARLVRQARPPRRPLGDYVALALGTAIALSSSLRSALASLAWVQPRHVPASQMRTAQ